MEKIQVKNILPAKTSSTVLVQETPDILPLHTNSATFLFHGRPRQEKKIGIPGCKRFFRLVNEMENACRGNDPWADWYFHRVDQAIAECHRFVTKRERQLRALIPKTRIERGEFVALKPHRVEYIRPGILGYQLMMLLEHVDDCLKLVIDVGKRGLLTQVQKSNHLWDLEKEFRGVIHTTNGWLFTGVTRDDCATRNVAEGFEGNPAVQRAVEAMGECPQVYVEEKVVSRFAPRPTKHHNTLRGESMSGVHPDGVTADTVDKTPVTDSGTERHAPVSSLEDTVTTDVSGASVK